MQNQSEDLANNNIQNISDNIVASQIALLAYHLSKTKETNDIYEQMDQATKLILHAKKHIDLRFSKT